MVSWRHVTKLKSVGPVLIRWKMRKFIRKPNSVCSSHLHTQDVMSSVSQEYFGFQVNLLQLCVMSVQWRSLWPKFLLPCTAWLCLIPALYLLEPGTGSPSRVSLVSAHHCQSVDWCHQHCHHHGVGCGHCGSKEDSHWSFPGELCKCSSPWAGLFCHQGKNI